MRCEPVIAYQAQNGVDISGTPKNTYKNIRKMKFHILHPDDVWFEWHYINYVSTTCLANYIIAHKMRPLFHLAVICLVLLENLVPLCRHIRPHYFIVKNLFR